MTRIALLQMTSGIEPEANARAIVEAVQAAASGGAAAALRCSQQQLALRYQASPTALVRRKPAT